MTRVISYPAPGVFTPDIFGNIKGLLLILWDKGDLLWEWSMQFQ